MTNPISVPVIKAFFHTDSSTISYVVHCSDTNKCVIIDPVLDFDIFSGKLNCQFALNIINYVQEQKLAVSWILETHAHADHVTAASYLKRKLGGKLACGANIIGIQKTFKELFNLETFSDNGEQFDQLLYENDILSCGNFTVTVMSTPGHTPDSVTYVIGNNAFVGDTLFMPDSGSARCDFPDGSASSLFDSIHKIYALGDDLILYMCHDYQPNNRDVKYRCTVAEQKKTNIQIAATITKEEYVSAREKRDRNLAVPRLIYPSLQLNMRAGNLPQPENNQRYYLKLPLYVDENLN